MTKKQNIIWISVITVLLLTAIAIMTTLLVLIKPKINTEPVNNGYVSEFTETINNVKWTVKYNTSTKVIIAISADYERTTSNDGIRIEELVGLSGVPLESGWFKIEKHEKISYYDKSDTPFSIKERTTRYEEKFLFTLP